MRCLVTGGTGFIGSCLVRKLISLGHKVFITGRANEQDTNIPCLSYTFHDLNWKTISPIDIVFHQAAITNTTHKPDSDFYFVNVQCSKTLFFDAARHGCRKFIYASSCAVYGNQKPPFHELEANELTPINPYGASKMLFDQWAISWAKVGLSVIGLRYSNVYGPIGESHKGESASMIYQLMCQMREGRPRLFKWGEQERDFIHVDDCVHANLLAIETKGSGVFNIGAGKSTSFNRIVELLNKSMKTSLSPEYIDNPFEGSYQNHTVCDLSQAKQFLGYEPQITVENGIEDCVRTTSSCSF